MGGWVSRLSRGWWISYKRVHEDGATPDAAETAVSATYSLAHPAPVQPARKVTLSPRFLIHRPETKPRPTLPKNRLQTTEKPLLGGLRGRFYTPQRVSYHQYEENLKTAARQQCQGPGFESRSRRTQRAITPLGDNAANAPAPRSNTSGSRVTPPLVLDGTSVSSSAASTYS
jgi:hypothetical protein